MRRLPKIRRCFPLMSICAINGKPARSRYRVVERFIGVTGLPLTRVILTPETGRTHQLRIHCRQQLGAPDSGLRPLWRTGSAGAETPWLMLHASELNFIHPVSGEPVNAVTAAPF